ncbi:hypothetical protein [Nesterenkonia halobia]|uniref:Tetratricopeptide repeat protein n=1 Tax=Nesterenkonia halobia TaxID=37922 RepID=A0ABP6RCJ4_9MICC
MLKPLVLAADVGRRAVRTAAKAPGADLALARAVVAAGRTVPAARGDTLRPDRSRLGALHEQAADVLFTANPDGAARLLAATDVARIDDADRLERLARRFLAVDEYEAALRLRRRAVDLQPENPVRWGALAASLRRSAAGGLVRDSVAGLVEGPVAEEEAARRALARAVELAGDDAEIRFELGCLTFDQGRTEDGLDHLQGAVARRPDARWLIEYAHRARRPHVLQLDRALDAYEQALDRAPHSNVALRGVISAGARAGQDWPRLWAAAMRYEASLRRGLARRQALAAELEPLVTAAHLDAERAETIMALLSHAETRGTRLRWATTSLIVLRLQFAGRLRDGFALRRRLAERTLDWLGRSSGGHAGHRQKVLAALLALGREQEALELIDPLPWEPDSRRGRRQLEKLRADAQLAAGEPGPYLEYSSQVRSEVPLPGEERMAALVAGRRVAVVGPAQTDDQLGELIDSYDVVVRTRFQAGFVAENAARLGSRTDITYYAGRDQELLAAEGAAAAEAGDLALVVARPLSMDAARGLLGGELPEWLRVARHDFSLCYHGALLGVPRIVYDVLQFDPAEIALFHADFYAGSQAYSAGYWEEQHIGFGPYSKMNDVIASHDLAGDFRFMQAVAATGRLTAHGASAEVMALDLDDYLERVEAAPLFG